MANYCTQVQIEYVHGSRNLSIWSDLDNTKNSVTIAARVAWAAELATEYVNGRFILGRYEVPFTSVPKIIIHLTALLSGILLYDGRVQSDQTRDMVLPKRKEFRRLMREILSGQLRLTHPTSGEAIECVAYTAPFNSGVSNDDIGLITNPNVPDSWCGICSCHTCVCRSLTLPIW